MAHRRSVVYFVLLFLFTLPSCFAQTTNLSEQLSGSWIRTKRRDADSVQTYIGFNFDLRKLKIFGTPFFGTP